MFWGSCLKCRSGFRHFGRDLGRFCCCTYLLYGLCHGKTAAFCRRDRCRRGKKNYLKFFCPFSLRQGEGEYAYAADTRIQLKMFLAVHFIKCGVFRICLVDCGNYGIARTFDGRSYRMFVVLRELYHSGVERSRPAERYGNLNTSRASYECENVDGFLTSESFERDVNVIVPCIFFHYLFLTVLSH